MEERVLPSLPFMKVVKSANDKHRLWGGTMFGDAVAWYLFLGGSGASALGISALLSWVAHSPRKHGELQRAAIRVGSDFYSRSYCIIAIVLLVGSLCLTADMGHPERLLIVFLRPRLSIITVGAFTLLVSLVCAAALALEANFSLKLSRAFMQALRVVAVVSSCVASLYTGFLLMSMYAVPFWNNLLMPIVFFFAGASCGIALLLAIGDYVSARGCFECLRRKLVTTDFYIIILETVFLAAYFLVALTEPSSKAAALAILVGDMKAPWWIGFACPALLLPLLSRIRPTRESLAGVRTLIPFFILVGGFFLRYCFVKVWAFD